MYHIVNSEVNLTWALLLKAADDPEGQNQCNDQEIESSEALKFEKYIFKTIQREILYLVENIYQRSEVNLEEELAEKGGELGPSSIQGELELHQFEGARRVFGFRFKDVLPFRVEIRIPESCKERLSLSSQVAHHPRTFVDSHL